jgi:hypothetical protein
MERKSAWSLIREAEKGAGGRRRHQRFHGGRVRLVRAFDDERVLPLQALDAGEYERLLALAHHGSHLGELLARKASGPYRHRDLAVWLKEDKAVADYHARLPAVEAIFQSMITELEPLYGTPEP